MVDQRGVNRQLTIFRLFFNNLKLAMKQVVQMCNYVDNLYDAKTISTQASNGYNSSKLAKVKGQDNQEWSRWRRGCVTEVPSFLGEVRLRQSGVEAQCSPRSHQGHRNLLTPSHNARCRDSTIGALEGGNLTFTNKVGAISTTLGGSQQHHEASPQWSMASR